MKIIILIGLLVFIALIIAFPILLAGLIPYAISYGMMEYHERNKK